MKSIPSTWIIRHDLKLKGLKMLLVISKSLKKQYEYINQYVERKTLDVFKKLSIEIKNKVKAPPKNSVGGGVGDRGEDNRRTHRNF